MPPEQQAEEKQAQVKKPRVRSPLYPFLPLSTAIERARRFYDAEKRHPATPQAAASHWGHSPKSSTGMQTIGALKQYGLLEDEAGASTRMVKLTPLALRILLDERDQSPEKTTAIRDAALRPKLFASLFEKWGAELPSEATARTHLVLELGFNEAVANDVIASYRDTLAYAGIHSSDSVIPEDPPPPPKDRGGGAAEGKGRMTSTTEQRDDEREFFVVRLGGGRTFRLVGSGPEPTQKIWGKLLAHLELNKDEFPEDEPADESPD